MLRSISYHFMRTARVAVGHCCLGLRIAAGPGLLAVVCGCAQTETTAPTLPAKPKKAPATVAAPRRQPAFVDGGPGLLVLDPQTPPADTASEDFAIGCSRWLFVQVGGQPDFGRTPLWTSVDRVRRENGFKDLRLSPEAASRFARLVGATHYAVGKISSIGSTLTLQYSVVAGEDRQQMGAPIAISGTQEQIAAALPRLAHDLCARLGLSNASLPAATELTASELRQIGSCVWAPPSAALDIATRLTPLRLKSPLAVLVSMDRARGQEQEALDEMAALALKTAPENAVVVGACAYNASNSLYRSKMTVIRTAGSFPKNANLALSEAMMHALARDYTARRAAAQRIVDVKPECADGHLALAAAIADETETVRRSRFSTELTQQEWNYIEPLYAEWERTASKATQLDPSNGLAWLRLATAATFSSDRARAVSAIGKALELLKGSPAVYQWGLQMFDVKWGGNEADRRRIGKRAVDAKFDFPRDAVTMADSLQEAGYQDLANQLLARNLSSLRAQVKKYPDDALGHRDLAVAHSTLGDTPNAVVQYREAIRLRPRNTKWLSQFGLMLTLAGKPEEALAQYEAILKITPGDNDAKYAVAYGLADCRRYAEAEKVLVPVVQTLPKFMRAHLLLGSVLTEMKRYPEAIATLERAIELNPRYVRLYNQLSKAYVGNQQFDKALEAATSSLQLAPNNVNANNSASVAYSKLGNHQQAMAYAQRALISDPKDGWAHLCMGDALNGLGRRAEAKYEWKLAVTLADKQRDNETTEGARDKLKVNP